MNIYEEIYHHGILGQKWGVRRFQNADGTLTKAGQRRYAQNKKIINREIEFQNKKIASLRAESEAYKKGAKEVRSEKALKDAIRAGYDEKTAREAQRLVAGRRDTEAAWREHQAKHIEAYNKRLSDADVSKMTKMQVHMLIQAEGNRTVREVNDTWTEPEVYKEYVAAKYGGK